MSESASIYSVAVVVDRAFGKHLAGLAQRVHVWVCATADNQRAANEYHVGREYSLESGITTFRVSDSDSPERMFIGVLPDVGLHHGEHAHRPPWQALEIYGVSATREVRDALARYGVREFVDTPSGFVCRRVVSGE